MEDFDAFWVRLKNILLRSYCSPTTVESLTPDTRLTEAIQNVRFLNMVAEVENTYGVSFSEKDPLYEILSTPRTLHAFLARGNQRIDP